MFIKLGPGWDVILPEIEVNEAYCYPNPVKIDQIVTFAKVAELRPIRLKVYDMSGVVVYEGKKDSNDKGEISWDLKNNKGEEVCPGIYI